MTQNQSETLKSCQTPCCCCDGVQTRLLVVVPAADHDALMAAMVNATTGKTPTNCRPLTLSTTQWCDNPECHHHAPPPAELN